jgi:hypothetical protein
VLVDKLNPSFNSKVVRVKEENGYEVYPVDLMLARIWFKFF